VEADAEAGREGAVRAHLIVVHLQSSDPGPLVGFAERLALDALPVLEAPTGLRWHGVVSGTKALSDQEPKAGADFLDLGLLRMVESPADLVVVVTDAALLTSQRRVVPGLAAPAANVVVVSTAKLVQAPFGHPVRALDDPVVRWNGATLLVHLLGHLLDLDHQDEGALRRFTIDPRRSGVDPLPAHLDGARQAARRLIEQEAATPTPWQRMRMQTQAAARRPRVVLGAVRRSRAPLLPLRLGRLSAAAVAPTFIILFTDEFWWAAIHLQRWYVWVTAALAVLVGTWFLLVSQRLLFPHRDRTTLTQHVALTNAVVMVNTFLLVLGLQVLVTAVVLLIQLLLFPADYLSAWFEQRFDVGWSDHVFLALVVASLGTLTGALGGSFHGRALLREYALFLDEP
jgi:hypothetical protein